MIYGFVQGYRLSYPSVIHRELQHETEKYFQSPSQEDQSISFFWECYISIWFILVESAWALEKLLNLFSIDMKTKSGNRFCLHLLKLTVSATWF